MNEFTYNWKSELPVFQEKSKEYFAGELKRLSFYGTAGRFGVATQRGDDKAMLRLRMPAGQVSKEKFLKIAEWVKEYEIATIHLTTGQSIQLHDLGRDALKEVMEKAIDAGIITMGMGGKFARNILCTPLTGVTADEPFDLTPYALAADRYTLRFITSETKLPHKLKIAFSNQPDDIAHATLHDLGFVAKEDGTFDVYSGGGMGLNPKIGVKVAEHVAPVDTVYYVKAMWLMYTAHGNYQMQGRARVRYLQETLGGPERFAEVFRENVKLAFEGEDLKVIVENAPAPKTTAQGETFSHPRVIPQKQTGLYSVRWHPVGGIVPPQAFTALADAIRDMENAEIRLSPEEEMFIINLTAQEARRVLPLTEEGARTRFERSVACVGSSICQFGVRDSQQTLRNCIEAAREAGLPDGALPMIYISGCPSTCAAHQAAMIGFRGGIRFKKASYMLYTGGCAVDGHEALGAEVGYIYEEDMPAFLVALGREVEASGKTFEEWYASEKEGEGLGAISEIAKPYLAE